MYFVFCILLTLQLTLQTMECLENWQWGKFFSHMRDERTKLMKALPAFPAKPVGSPTLLRAQDSISPGAGSPNQQSHSRAVSSSPQFCPALPWALPNQGHPLASACPCLQGDAWCPGLGLPLCPSCLAPGWGSGMRQAVRLWHMASMGSLQCSWLQMLRLHVAPTLPSDWGALLNFHSFLRKNWKFSTDYSFCFIPKSKQSTFTSG